MQHLEVSCAVRTIWGPLGVKGLKVYHRGCKHGARQSYKAHQFIACCFQTVLFLDVRSGPTPYRILL